MSAEQTFSEKLMSERRELATEYCNKLFRSAPPPENVSVVHGRLRFRWDDGAEIEATIEVAKK
jgi:hypothetical protein